MKILKPQRSVGIDEDGNHDACALLVCILTSIGPVVPQGIHDLVIEMFDDTAVKLSHVLPQFSQDGGIVMQVNGILTRKVYNSLLLGT